MPINGNPEIIGPGAHEVEPIIKETDKQPPVVDANLEPQIDPAFPFGRPDQIDWLKIDEAGITLLKEVNLRPWMKSTEYCSGHPLNRPSHELSALYPYVTGENVYEEIAKLDLAYIRGLVTDVYFRHRKQELRETGSTRFYLNVNVYDITIFQEWVKLLSTFVLMATNVAINPVIVRYNPLRVGMNYTISWDYWSLEERDLIHAIAIESLLSVPV